MPDNGHIFNGCHNDPFSYNLAGAKIVIVSSKGRTGTIEAEAIENRKGRGKMFKRKGFTLIELLIVIAVISILIGIALPRFKGMQDEGNRARAKGELRTLRTGVESFSIHAANRALPTVLGNLNANTTVPNIIGSTLPTDPFKQGTNYGYANNGGYYAIWSVGIDGAAGVNGISNTGAITGTPGDDIYVSNGDVQSGG